MRSCGHNLAIERCVATRGFIDVCMLRSILALVDLAAQLSVAVKARCHAEQHMYQYGTAQLSVAKYPKGLSHGLIRCYTTVGSHSASMR